MLTDSSRVYLQTAGLGLVLAVVYGIVTGDRAGIFLYLALAAVAGYVGGVMVAQRDEPVTAGDGPPSLRPVPPAPTPGGGAWPLLGAVSVTLFLAGLVLGAPVIAAGVVLAVATGVGWLARVSGEHTGRLVSLLPLALPVLGLFSIASLIFFMSRILLAVSAELATTIALLVAVAILGGAVLIASRPSISGRKLAVVLAVAGVLMVAAGLVAAAAGQRHVERHGAHEEKAHGRGAGAETVTVTAAALAFAQREIHLKAQQPVDIRLENKDVGTPHNITIATGQDFANAVFRGDIITGDRTIDYHFTAPAPGSYAFRCDVHPHMQGKVTVA